MLKTNARNGPTVTNTVSSISVLVGDHSIRWSTFAKHLAEVIRELLRLLNRGKMTAALVIRLENHVTRRPHKPAAHFVRSACTQYKVNGKRQPHLSHEKDILREE